MKTWRLRDGKREKSWSAAEIESLLVGRQKFEAACARLMERFWSCTDVRGPDDCWHWMGSMTDAGYGSFTYFGCPTPAHVISFCHKNDGSPDDGVVRHTCDNRGCVNPRHLIYGTQLDNVQDMIARGRHSNGYGRTNAKVWIPPAIVLAPAPKPRKRRRLSGRTAHERFLQKQAWWNERAAERAVHRVPIPGRVEWALKEAERFGYDKLEGEYRAERIVLRRLEQGCYVKTHKEYPLYGGRGVKLWFRWRCDEGPPAFVRFLNCVGPRPTRLHKLVRVDSKGHFEPGNVRWEVPL